MKSIGRKSVEFHTYIDNVYKGMSQETRTVYQKSDGSFWINLNGYKSKVDPIDSMAFKNTVRIHKVTGMTGEEVINKFFKPVDTI